MRMQGTSARRIAAGANKSLDQRGFDASPASVMPGASVSAADVASGHLSLNSGLRFSANAAIPSFWSSVANMAWKTRRSKRMPSDSVVS